MEFYELFMAIIIILFLGLDGYALWKSESKDNSRTESISRK